MELLLWVAVVLAGVCALLLIAALWMIAGLRRTRTDPSEKLAVLADRLSQIGASVSSEFERSRREQSLFQEQMRRQTSEELGAMAKQIEGLRADNYAQMNRMQESNEKKLDEMRKTVDEKLTETLGTRLDASFKTVSHQLDRVLTNVKARGTWAEVQLRSVLDQTISGMYVENYAPDPLAKDRVEFAVRIPSTQGSEAYLPIDSKFPMEDYVRFCQYAESGDAQAAAAARKALETVVLHEARTVSKYIHVPQTTPFAILYLATEGLYAEILSSRSGIAERIQRECGVLLAGPTTITALLNSLSLGFRAVAVNEKANEVRLLLAAARQQYDKFGDVLQKARKKIDEAGRSLDEAQDRNRIIAGKLKHVETIGDEQAQTLLYS